MDVITTSFVLCLLVFFFTHCFYFFNLNWKSRLTIYFVNIVTVWGYIAYVGYLLLSFRIGLFENYNQHLLLMGLSLLIIFTVTDFFSGSKSLGLIFSVMVLLLGTTGVVNIHYQPEIYSLGEISRTQIFFIFLEKLAILFFFVAIILSIFYHYSFIEIKYHHRFFFSNRFPGFDRLWYYIDNYLLSGVILTSLTLFLSLNFNHEWVWSLLFNNIITAIIVLYYLALLYIRYRKWFSSKLSLYWMLLSILLLITKIGFWL